jgi:hypothetical protein
MTTRHFVTRLHPDDRVDPGKAGPQVMRHVTVNVAESPLAWLAARGMVSDAHYRAGERLRTDYERAGLAGRVTMRWPRWRASTRIDASMPRWSMSGRDWPTSAGG